MKYSDALEFARNLRKNQTPAEIFFWSRVRNRKFLGKKFKRQYLIQYFDEIHEKAFFIADFYCHEIKLVIEIDGKIHEKQKVFDQYREDIIRSLGYQVIRFTNKEVIYNWQKVQSTLAPLFE